MNILYSSVLGKKWVSFSVQSNSIVLCRLDSIRNQLKVDSIAIFFVTYLRTSSLNIQKGSNNIDNNYDEHFIIMQATIEDNKKEMKYNKQDSDDKIMKLTENFKVILASTIT